MNTKRKSFVGLTAIALLGICLVFLVLVTGCASIIHGSDQEVGISSSPTGASVLIDNVSYGVTPTVAKLSRKDKHSVKITMDGYQPFEAAISRGTSGWVWGNIIFGGLIGLVVDASTGSMYKLTPEQVSATLTKGDMGYLYQKDALYIAAVLEADPTWEKIATLQSTETGK